MLVSEVLRIDWFGNIQLAATGDDLAAAGLEGTVEVNGLPATVGEKFADVGAGDLLVYVNSAGHVAVARRGSSAERLLDAPTSVTVRPT